MYKVLCIFFAFIVAGCSQLPRTSAPPSDHNSNEYQDYWYAQLQAFDNASVDEIKKPYFHALNKVLSWPSDDLCSDTFIAQAKQALAYNNTSLTANYLLMNCAHVAGDDAQVQSYSHILHAVSAAILRHDQGVSAQSAFSIREFDEIYILAELNNWHIFDIELTPSTQTILYKVHSYDGNSQRFVYRYAKNDWIFNEVFRLVADQPELNATATMQSFMTLIAESGDHDFHQRQRRWLQKGENQLLINEQAPLEERTPLATVLLAQAYFNSGQMEALAELTDDLVLLSDNGYAEAQVFLAQQQFSHPKEAVRERGLASLEEIDYGRPASLAMQILLQQAKSRADFEDFIVELIPALPAFYLQAVYLFADSQKPTAKLATLNEDFYLKLLETLAENGHGEAGYDLAWIYLNGRYGIEKNQTRGIELITMSAESGFHWSQLDLGVFYGSGARGLKKDKQKAFDLYQQAVEQNNYLAMMNVASYYRSGTAVEKDVEQALTLYQRAQALNHLDAYCEAGSTYMDYVEQKQVDLAMAQYQQGVALGGENNKDIADCYYGLGIIYKFHHVDFTQALKWFQLAQQQGRERADLRLAYLYSDTEQPTFDAEASIHYHELALANGYGEAAANLGYIYETGIGVAKDYDKALAYYQRATEMNSEIGINNLATLYIDGTGVEQNIAKGLELYERAFAMGNEYAASNLGDLYRDGVAVEQDYVKACQYYQIALARGHESGNYNMGYCALGEYLPGVPAEKAVEYFSADVAQGGLDSTFQLGLLYLYGEHVEKDLKQAEQYFIEAVDLGMVSAKTHLAYTYELLYPGDLNRAFVLYKQAAEGGDPDAMFNLGMFYKGGHGTTQDVTKSVVWIEKAINNGNRWAAVELGNMYWQGELLVENKPQACDLYSQAYDMGNIESYEPLAKCYYLGQGRDQNKDVAFNLLTERAEIEKRSPSSVIGSAFYFGLFGEVDYEQARIYYQKAVGDQSSSAMNYLGEIYRYGQGTEVDLEKAIEYYRMANDSNQNSGIGAYNLGEMYLNGEHFAVDPQQAFVWFSRSAERGFVNSFYQLGKLYLSGQGTPADQEQAKYWLSRAAELNFAEAAELLETLN